MKIVMGSIAWAIVLALIAVVIWGCSHTVYNPITKEIVVDRFLDDNELSGLEIVFPDGSYVVIDKSSSKVGQEVLAVLQLLIKAGLLAPPAVP